MRRLSLSLLLLLALGAASLVAQPDGGKSSWVNGPEYGGERITCDLAQGEQIWNRGGSDGAGMCVMTSIEMLALYHGLEEYRGLRDWCAREPGGAYPSKVDRQLAAYCKAKGLPPPRYVQVEGDAATITQALDLLDRTGRGAGVTYGYSPRYRGTIGHMVFESHFGAKYGVIRDNNKIGGFDETHLSEWMSREELVKRICHPSGRGWVFAWLEPPPPPLPPKKVGV